MKSSSYVIFAAIALTIVGAFTMPLMLKGSKNNTVTELSSAPTFKEETLPMFSSLYFEVPNAETCNFVNKASMISDANGQPCGVEDGNLVVEIIADNKVDAPVIKYNEAWAPYLKFSVKDNKLTLSLRNEEVKKLFAHTSTINLDSNLMKVATITVPSGMVKMIQADERYSTFILKNFDQENLKIDNAIAVTLDACKIKTLNLQKDDSSTLLNLNDASAIQSFTSTASVDIYTNDGSYIAEFTFAPKDGFYRLGKKDANIKKYIYAPASQDVEVEED